MSEHTLTLTATRVYTVEMIVAAAESARVRSNEHGRHRKADRWAAVRASARASWTEFRLTFREAVGMIRDAVMASPEAAAWVVLATCLLGATIGASR